MFQRQLSTTALGSPTANMNLNSSSSAHRGAQAGMSPASGQMSATPTPPTRMFQRQMTASQLLSSSSTTSSAAAAAAASNPQDPLTNKQRAAALLASARGELAPIVGQHQTNLANSTTCLNNKKSEFDQQNKKPVKNKRIISRMLSISAIHTSALGGGSNSNSSIEQQQQNSNSHFGIESNEAISSTFNMMTTNATGPTATLSDQVPDKIDSSFTRSRSSSNSSNNAANQAEQQQNCSSIGESIQCLCFLDWNQAQQASCASGGGGGGQAAIAHQAAPQQAGGGGGGSTTMNSNNKSLSSIDNSTAGQLSLWLGTSQGSVLLVSLTMPDSEDNRVLQLQSVLADPLPQAGIKLRGSILCLSTFFSTLSSARLQAATSGGPAGSQGSLSLEAPDSVSNLAAGPATAASSASSTTTSTGPVGSSTGVPSATSGGGHLRQQDSAAHDTRMFFAIVSEKQAKVFQVVPAPAAGSSSPGAQTTTEKSSKGSSSSSSSSDHHHYHPHHHHHGASSKSSSGGHHQQQALTTTPLHETEMAKLLVNKSNCVSKLDLSETSYACKANVIQMRQPDESCLVTYMATGNILAHSLPVMRQTAPLLDADFVPFTNQRIASSMCFSSNGHCLYQPSINEISKFTISSQYKLLINEMTGSLYVPRDMPEMPRPNFFKSLFSVTSSVSSKQSERDELFGECSAGKGSRGVAKHIGSAGSSGSGGSGPSGLDKLKGAAVGTMGHDMRVAREGLDERGEKLSEIEDQTLLMMNQSESYAQTAHQLAQKFKDKKWYQF